MAEVIRNANYYENHRAIQAIVVYHCVLSPAFTQHNTIQPLSPSPPHVVGKVRVTLYLSNNGHLLLLFPLCVIHSELTFGDKFIAHSRS